MEHLFEVSQVPQVKDQEGKAPPQTIDRMSSDLVGTFHDPIIVMPGGWGDTLPARPWPSSTIKPSVAS